MCDANDCVVEAALGQRCEKIFQTTHYASKTLNKASLCQQNLELSSNELHHNKERDVSSSLCMW